MLARKGVEAQIAKEKMVYVLLIEKIEKGMPVDDDDRVLLRDLANYLVR
jgi:gluconate kinase